MSRLRTAAGAALLALAMAACSTGNAGTPQAERAAASPTTATPSQAADDHAAPAKLKPLRSGERRVKLAMPEAYTPSAPYGTGTDDYRCFVLDPHLTRDAFITGLNILPGTPSVVHHVILFRLPPSAAAAAEDRDAAEPGEGWTCFGDTGLRTQSESLDEAPWLGAWAPGGSEQVMADDVGVPMERGPKVIMQVHYNLLAGPKPDVTTAQLRLAPKSKDLAALETVLMPAPVELPCRAGHDTSPIA